MRGEKGRDWVNEQMNMRMYCHKTPRVREKLAEVEGSVGLGSADAAGCLIHLPCRHSGFHLIHFQSLPHHPCDMMDLILHCLSISISFSSSSPLFFLITLFVNVLSPSPSLGSDTFDLFSLRLFPSILIGDHCICTVVSTSCRLNNMSIVLIQVYDRSQIYLRLS